MKSRLVKCSDGVWRYEHTPWNYVLDYLVDAFSSFSEEDMQTPEFICIRQLCDLIDKRLDSNSSD